MRYSWIRWGLTAIVILSATFIGQRVMTHIQQNASRAPAQPTDRNQADAWIKDFTYQQSQSGSAKWEVLAERAQVFNDKHLANLENVEVHLFGEGDKEMTVVAEQGTIDTATNNFNLRNQEDMITVHFANGFTILSDHLQWVEASHNIKTQAPVIIHGHGLTITGTGLVGSLDDENFKILDNVRAEVSS